MALYNLGHFTLHAFLLHSRKHMNSACYGFEISYLADTCFFFFFFFLLLLLRLLSFPELWPLENIWMKSCQHNISKTIEAGQSLET